MKAPELNERTLKLIIKKTFDELTPEESYELLTISDDEFIKPLIKELLDDKDKLMDYIQTYTKENVECDNEKLEKAKREFDKLI